ncbi:MAG: hypothetical protein M1836_000615 [Candelina mexicana]|nr:MAG: hypothetical protein M1836_000615 [Candelina mexicana]
MPPFQLNVKTGVEDGTKNFFPPQTPDSSVPRKKVTPSNTQHVRPSPRETFLDDSTPVDSAVGGGGENGLGRDSHDLSFPSRHITRDSVVDKMLLSLDQFSSTDEPAPTGDPGQPYSNQGDAGDGQLPNTQSTSPTSKGGRSRGHTHSSSLSSEYDLQADDSSSRFSSRFSRGRRSNSSSNFQSALGRIDSVRAEPYSARGKVFLAQRAAAPGERQLPTHLHGGKRGSKSSGSSVDFGYAQTLGSNNWASPTRQRASSFDYGHGDRSLQDARSNMIADRLISHAKVDPAAIVQYDAAPTPVVRVGPRKRHSPPPISYPSKSVYAPPQAPPLTHGTSYGSLSNPRVLNEGSETIDANKRKARPNEFQALSDPRELPPLPAFIDPPAPSPTISFRKPSIPLTLEVSRPPKERPGFFRRVFGSSKHQTPTQRDLHQSQTSRAQTPISMYNESVGDTNHPQAAPQFKSSNDEQPPREFLIVRKEPPPPLNKKTSSFFRRRKKSVSEYKAPAAAPMQLQAVRDAERATQSSPVSSLRKVMDPYIKSPVGSPQYFYDSGEYFDINEEDKSRLTQQSIDAQSPPRDEPGRKVESKSRDQKQNSRTISSASGTNPNVRSYPGDARDVIDGSFLHDSSGNEEKGGRFDSSKKLPPLPVEQMFTKGSKKPSENEKPHKVSRAGEKATINTHTAEKTIPKSSWKHPNFLRSTHAQTPVAINQVDRPSDATAPSKLTDDAASASAKKQTQSPVGSETSEEHLSGTKRLRKISGLTLPLEGTKESAKVSPSSSSDYRSASSLPIVSNEDDDGARKVPEICEPVAETQLVDSEPTIEDRERAKRIFDGDHDFVGKAGAAAWLGESSSLSARARKAYMELFDMSNINILAALRAVCERLTLKAETQQVDRILDAFSTRWCECNPNHGFKATDVVHTICYSILLLNTDLHLADIEQKMTRNQFVKNTMPTIRRVAADAAPEDFETIRASTIPARGSIPWIEPESPQSPSGALPQEAKDGRCSFDTPRPTRRLSTMISYRSDREQSNPSPTPLDFDTTDDCGPLVKAPFHGSSRTWEIQVEIVLKDFYNCIRQNRLPLHGAPTERLQDQVAQTSSLSVLTGGMLRRSSSALSKAPSENMSYRGRPADHRFGTGRWSSKTRTRTRLYPNSAMGSSRTSLDDQSSVWSPSISSTWSKYSSLGKTQTSMSVNSLGSNFLPTDYQQSIGFANALSQAIIREETVGSIVSDETMRVAPLLEDETLGLAGAPWAKEGIIKHKHHLEAIDKKAKGRNWNECFAVVEKGWMRLFSFNANKSTRGWAKSRQASGGVVGGGNWSENAEALGSFLLRQTIASALPPPGYSKARPHVWALSLPTGAVHLFQVGTPEIIKEFVSTANYWSARLSKEPLVGGISNIEYGWGDAVINHALINLEKVPPLPSSSGPRQSLQSSIRSSMDQGHTKPRLPGDRITISDWAPPQQSMMASALLEIDQLKALMIYVKNIEEDLQKHNEMRAPMLLAFSPRHPNSAKAMANWERKSSYLLREIVKFRTYIDCLTAAQLHKESIYAGRERSATEPDKAPDLG